MTPRWLLWAEILLIVAVLAAIGVARFSRITAAETLEIQLEAGMLQLWEMEADHFERHGVYFHPDDPSYRHYLPWMTTYAYTAHCTPETGFAVVVQADLDGDGEAGSWRMDQTVPVVTRVAED